MLQIIYPPKGAKVVTSLSGFPAPIAGVINLPAGSDWQISGEVDLLGNRIVCLGIVSINGISSETSILKSTGLASALITTAYSLPMQNLAITANLVFAINGGGTASIKLFSLNLISCAAIGTIKNIANLIIENSTWRNSTACVLDGTIGIISTSYSGFDTPPSGALFTVAATAVITRRFRFTFCTMIVPSGVVGINIIAGASLPNDMFILTDIGFSGGSANYVQGVLASDNRNRWEGCRGVQNDTNSAYYFMQNNAIATVIAAINTFVDIAGTTTAGALQRFTHSNNRADYVGILSRSFMASATATLTAGNNQTVSLRFVVRNAANTVIATSPAIDVTTSDYIRPQVANASLTNVVVGDLIVIVK
jgi:hypothetical protein